MTNTTIKLLLAGAVAAVGITSQAQVYSNIVGFQKVDVPANGLRMATTPWTNPTNTIQNLVAEGLTGATGPGMGDEIWFWDVPTQNYDTHWLYENAGNPADPNNGTWVDETFAPSTAEIENGEGLWFISKSATNQTVVFTGDVNMAPTSTVEIVQGLQMISYTYSDDIALSNATFFASGARGNTGPGIGDELWTWDADNQQYVTHWIYENAGNPADPNNGTWVDESFQPASTVLEAGTGFWYIRKDAATFDWVETRPYNP